MLVFYSSTSCLNLYYLYSDMTLREQEFSRLFQVLPSIMRNVRSMYVRANHFSRVRLFATLLVRQAALSMGFSRQEYCGGLPWPPPEHLPHPGIEPVCVMPSALAGGFFTMSATWEALSGTYVHSTKMFLTDVLQFLLYSVHWFLLLPESEVQHLIHVLQGFFFSSVNV